MQDLNDLYYFVQVVEHGGFAPAGRALGQPKSKLSRRVALLEDRLGVRLLHRSSRRFSLTETGQVYLAHCQAMLVEAAAAQEAIDSVRAEPRGVVRIACPEALLSARVDAVLVDYMARYPQVQVHVDATSRRVDVIAERLDIALGVLPPPLPDSGLNLRVFGPAHQCVVGSPALLASRPRPATPDELAAFPSLALGWPQDDHVWHLFGPDGAQVRVPHRPRLVTLGMDTLVTAARAGLGIVRLSEMVIVDPLASGALVPVLPGWAPRPYLVHAVFPSRRGLLPSVRLLIDHLADAFAKVPASRAVAR